MLDDFHAAGADAVAAFVDGLVLAAPRRLHTILICSRQAPHSPVASPDHGRRGGADGRRSPLFAAGDGRAAAPGDRRGRRPGCWQNGFRRPSAGGPPPSGSSRSAGAPARVLRPPRLAGERPRAAAADYLGEEVLARLPAHQRDLLLRASLARSLQRAAPGSTRDGPRWRAGLSRRSGAPARTRALSRDTRAERDLVRLPPPVSGDPRRRVGANGGTPTPSLPCTGSIAAWFATAGLTRDAVHHFVEAGDIPAAAALIESRLSEAFAREDWQSVASWLRADPERRRSEGEPELLLASAWVAYLSGRDARIAEVLEAMRDPAIPPPDLRCPARRDGLPRRLARRRSERVGQDRGRRHRAHSLEQTVSVRLRPPGARDGLDLGGTGDEALARLAAFTDRESARIDAASIRGYFGRVVVLWQAGRLARCEQTAADLLQLAPDEWLAPLRGLGRGISRVCRPRAGRACPGHAPFRGGVCRRRRVPFRLRARCLLRPDPGLPGSGFARAKPTAPSPDCGSSSSPRKPPSTWKWWTRSSPAPRSSAAISPPPNAGSRPHRPDLDATPLSPSSTHC